MSDFSPLASMKICSSAFYFLAPTNDLSFTSGFNILAAC